MMETDLNTLATELIEIKIQIKKFLDQERLLKEQIMPLVKEQGAINLEAGRVYYGESKGAATFSRKEVIQYLRDGYGDALADQIDQDCTKVGNPRQTVYVKLNDL